MRHKKIKNRKHYSFNSEYDYAVCCLSGEPIIRPKDFTIEHYCPKSKLPHNISHQSYNLRPAIKIINNIKGNLFPCEWEEQKLGICIHALKNYHIDNYESDLLKRCIFKFQKEGPQNVCPLCVLNLTNMCIKKKTR